MCNTTIKLEEGKYRQTAKTDFRQRQGESVAFYVCHSLLIFIVHVVNKRLTSQKKALILFKNSKSLKFKNYGGCLHLYQKTYKVASTYKKSSKRSVYVLVL